MAHPFELTHEIQVDATPDDVWEAIATGPGVDAWFMGRNEVEPREGGTTRMTFPGSTEEGTVTAWEPPTRFAYRTPEGADGAFHAFEYLVEGREKGSTVVRWVHSGFLGENWEAEYEGLSEGDLDVGLRDRDAVAVLQAVDEHLGVRVPDAPQQDLPGLLLALEPQGRVLGHEPL